MKSDYSGERWGGEGSEKKISRLSMREQMRHRGLRGRWNQVIPSSFTVISLIR